MKYIKTFENKNQDTEKEYFLKYMIDYYGINDGYYEIFTKQQIEKYIDFFINKRKELGTWGNADSFDREVFRDYLLFKYNFANFQELEYNAQLKDYLTEEEINANKYNL